MTCSHCQSSTLGRVPYYEASAVQWRVECPVCNRGWFESPGDPQRGTVTRVRRDYIDGPS